MLSASAIAYRRIRKRLTTLRGQKRCRYADREARRAGQIHGYEIALIELKLAEVEERKASAK